VGEVGIISRGNLNDSGELGKRERTRERKGDAAEAAAGNNSKGRKSFKGGRVSKKKRERRKKRKKTTRRRGVVKGERRKEETGASEGRSGGRERRAWAAPVGYGPKGLSGALMEIGVVNTSGWSQMMVVFT
jgi:hypothetical protein